MVSIHREENINSKNFYKISEILNTIANKYKIPIIVSTHPRTRKKIEESNGFSESIISREEKKKIPFFHLGPKNNWQKNFDKEFIEKLNNIFKKNLIELGYK